MRLNPQSSSPPVARAVLLAPWVEQVARLGAPAERLLERAGIPPRALASPSALISVDRGLRWIELACRDLGTEHLGLKVGAATSYDDLGAYGRALTDALTLHDYLRKGIALYCTVIRGQSFWLSSHGPSMRLHVRSVWEPRLADYQSCLNTFTITVAHLRKFAGPTWSPTEVAFGFRPEERLREDHGLGDTRIVYRTDGSYLEFPRAMLGSRMRPAKRARHKTSRDQSLPERLAELVKLQIRALLPGGAVPVELVAETLGTSPRSLQRALGVEGVSYSDLLSDVRMRRAARWLEHTDKPVLEIALDLGYSDASNFTRAFRRRAGVAPTEFRAAAGAK